MPDAEWEVPSSWKRRRRGMSSEDKEVSIAAKQERMDKWTHTKLQKVFKGGAREARRNQIEVRIQRIC